jgi:hypothetical protein
MLKAEMEMQTTVADADKGAREFAASQELNGVSPILTATSCAILLGRIVGACSDDPVRFNTGLNMLFAIARTSGERCFKLKHSH